MKKRILTFILALFLIPCAFLLGACVNKTVFIVTTCPYDKYFESNLTYYVEIKGQSNFTHTMHVIHNRVFIPGSGTSEGQYLDVEYLDFESSGSSTWHYKMIRVAGSDDNVFKINEDGDGWDKVTSSYTIRDFGKYYGTADSFGWGNHLKVVSGRYFKEKYIKEKTSDYIVFEHDGESVKLTNDDNHICLRYYYDTGSTIESIDNNMKYDGLSTIPLYGLTMANITL